jgi:uncharacterized protein
MRPANTSITMTVAPASADSATLDCPKCNAAMQRRSYDQGLVYRCEGCAGMWFPMLEFEHLREMAETIDTGNAEAATLYNAIDRIDCPACKHYRLIRMVDADQPHIYFESCKFCYGRFYDAGEFRDFADFSIDDFFKQFSAKARD